jgi:hypothetical protein
MGDGMTTEHHPLRGNLHAIEYLLGQLFVAVLENVDNPQEWIRQNATEAEAKIMRANDFDQEEKDAAYGTVRRVMETASMHFEAAGRGPTVDLRSGESRRDGES